MKSSIIPAKQDTRKKRQSFVHEKMASKLQLDLWYDNGYSQVQAARVKKRGQFWPPDFVSGTVAATADELAILGMKLHPFDKKDCQRSNKVLCCSGGNSGTVGYSTWQGCERVLNGVLQMRKGQLGLLNRILFCGCCGNILSLPSVCPVAEDTMAGTEDFPAYFV